MGRSEEVGVPPELVRELLVEVRRLRKQNERVEQHLREIEGSKGQGLRGKAGRATVDHFGAALPSRSRSSLISPAMEETLSAVERLEKDARDADADEVSAITQRSKTRESQYLSFLSRVGALTQERRGHRILYRRS